MFLIVADRIDSFEIGLFHRRNSLKVACEEGGWPRRGWQRLVQVPIFTGKKSTTCNSFN